jgi:hypothetical protein
MAKKWIAPAAAISLLVSGCGINGSPNDLVRAPAMESNQHAINQALMEFLPPGARLTLPLRPEYARAVNQEDLNGDGMKEVIAFYKNGNNEFEVGILVLENKGDAWAELANVHGVGRDLEFADYRDMNGDNKKEMLIGWGGGEDLNSELTIYSMKDQSIHELWNQSYSEMDIGDLDGDGHAEIAILQHDREQSEAKALLYGYREGKFTEIDELPMDGSVNGYEQVMIGRATPAQTGIFVDADIGAHSAVTDLLVLDHGGLKNVLQGPDGLSQAFKAYPLPSADVNNDGIIEIGLQKEPDGSEDLAMAEIPWINGWYQWDGKNGLKLVRESYADYETGYEFYIPGNWTGKFTAKIERDEETNAIGFYYIGQPDKSPAELLTIRLYKKADWPQQEAKWKEEKTRYTRLGENNDQVIAAVQPSGLPDLNDRFMKEYKQLLLDETEVRNFFQLIH